MSFTVSVADLCRRTEVVKDALEMAEADVLAAAVREARMARREVASMRKDILVFEIGEFVFLCWCWWCRMKLEKKISLLGRLDW